VKVMCHKSVICHAFIENYRKIKCMEVTFYGTAPVPGVLKIAELVQKLKYTHTHTYTRTHAHTHVYTRTHIHTTYTRTHTHKHTLTHARAHTRTRTHLYTNIHVYTHIYTCTHMHTHTHTHTHAICCLRTPQHSQGRMVRWKCISVSSVLLTTGIMFAD